MSIDVDKLAAEFDMLNSKDAEIDEAIEASFEVPEPAVHNPNTVDPLAIITENVNKANLLLNDIMKEIASGNTSPRMYEVASALINATTQAADRIFTSQLAYDTMDLKQKLYNLKEKELAVKEKFLELRGGKTTSVNQNILITDRETVLRMLRNPQNLIGEGEKDDGQREFGLQDSNSESEGG
jgi:hypothetical protein